MSKQASGKKTVRMSKKEWQSIGKKAGWDNINESELKQKLHELSLAYEEPIWDFLYEVMEDGFPSKVSEKTLYIINEAVENENWEPFKNSELYRQYRNNQSKGAVGINLSSTKNGQQPLA